MDIIRVKLKLEIRQDEIFWLGVTISANNVVHVVHEFIIDQIHQTS